MTTAAAADKALIDKLNAAVAEHNAAEQAVTTAQAELVSKSKAVGLLLLEAKTRHPKAKDFEAFLKRVNGLGISRAYDCMRIAGGRTTDEELRREARERVRKHRANKKIPKPDSVTPPDVTESPKLTPEPISVTKPHVTESQEIPLEQRRRENANLGMTAAERSKPSLAWFAVACREYLPNITVVMHREEARQLVAELTKAKAA